MPKLQIECFSKPIAQIKMSKIRLLLVRKLVHSHAMDCFSCLIQKNFTSFSFTHQVLKSLLIVIVFFIFCIGCDKKEIAPESGIVARVGNHDITAREFQLNYEFGFAHLKESPDKKASYLKYMINETLLSIEGYRLGLDKTDLVQNLEQSLLEELLVEELVKKEVEVTVQISPEEVKQAVMKSKIRWKLRYWAEPNLDIAENVYQLMQEQGYTNVVQKIITNNHEIPYQLKDFETDYLTWMDVPAELLEAIKNLQIGEISKPVELNKAYYLFQITDIRRGGISDFDYQNTYKRYEQILFYSQLQEKTISYTAAFMTQKNIVTKGKEFQILWNALSEWKQQNNNSVTFSSAIDNAGKTEPALWELKRKMENSLINFEGGQFSLKEIINRFDPASITAEYSAKQQLRKQLQRQIALIVRNYLFAKEAIAQGLHKSFAVENQLQAWRNKWVYEESRRYYTKSITIDDLGVQEYFRNNKSRYKTGNGMEPVFTNIANQAKQHAYFEQAHLLLKKKIQMLEKVNTVKIYQAVLDTVVVTDFKKSRWASLFVFKGNTDRMAVPIVDSAWGF